VIIIPPPSVFPQSMPPPLIGGIGIIVLELLLLLD